MVDVVGGETVEALEPDAVADAGGGSKPLPGVRSSGVWLRGSAPVEAKPSSAHRSYSSELLRDLFRPSEGHTPPPRKRRSVPVAAKPPMATATLAHAAPPTARLTGGLSATGSEKGLPREMGGRPCFLELPRLALLELPPELGAELSNEPPNWQAFVAPEAPKARRRFPVALVVALVLLASTGLLLAL